MKKLTKIALTASFVLALAFTFSCSGEDGTSCMVDPKTDGSGYDVICGGVNVGPLSNGEKGEPGATGANGEKGEQGEKGEKGEKGETGAAGVNCAVQPKAGGYDVLCGGVNMGQLSNGEGCAITTDASNSAYYLITCGSTSGQLAKAWCGATAYDPAKITCNNGILKFSFTDNRDNKTYKAVKIGEQIWMAENLNYNASGSKCGNDNEYTLSYANTSICNTYGRFYDWATAMNLLPVSICNAIPCASQISAKHKGICPDGWHIPSDAEWSALMQFVNPDCSPASTCADAGRFLKSVSGWYENGNGEDKYGFTALSSGFGDYSNFYDFGKEGDWWSTTEYAGEDEDDQAYYRYVYYRSDRFIRDYNGKTALFSIRCVQD